MLGAVVLRVVPWNDQGEFAGRTVVEFDLCSFVSSLVDRLGVREGANKRIEALGADDGVVLTTTYFVIPRQCAGKRNSRDAIRHHTFVCPASKGLVNPPVSEQEKRRMHLDPVGLCEPLEA